jgi:hypothetical protein
MLYGHKESRRADSNRFPLLITSDPSGVAGGLHSLANPAYLKRFLCSGLLRVAPYCVPGGIRVVSRAATAIVRRQVQWHALATFRATIRRHRFLGVAGNCINRLSKPISLHAVARGFCVLRSEWCQKWCQTVLARAPSSVSCVLPRPLLLAQATSLLEEMTYSPYQRNPCGPKSAS